MEQFDPALLEAKPEAAQVLPQPTAPEVDLAALMEENRALKEELTARREEQRESYVPKPLDLTEYKTRKLYIDAMLTDAGWTEGKDWLNEVPLPGMPNKSEVGYADYVLYDDTHRPPGGDRGQAHLRGPVQGPPAGQAVRRSAGTEIRPPAGDLPHQRL